MGGWGARAGFGLPSSAPCPSPRGSPPAGQIPRPEGRTVNCPAPAASAAHGLDRGFPVGQAAQRASRHSAKPLGAEASKGRAPQEHGFVKDRERTGHSPVSKAKSSLSQSTGEKDADRAGACPEEAGVRGQAAAGGGSYGLALSGQGLSRALLSGRSCSAASVDRVGRGEAAWLGWGAFQKRLPQGWTEGTTGPGAQNRVRCLGSADGGSGQSERQEEGGPGGVTAGRGVGY